MNFEIEMCTLKGLKVSQGDRFLLMDTVREHQMVWLCTGYTDGSTTWTVLFDTPVGENTPVSAKGLKAFEAKLLACREALWNAGCGWVEIVEEEVEA
jgi:hypothetical protein